MRPPRLAPSRARRPGVGLALTVLLGWVLVPTQAGAVPTCLFDAPTATVTVDVGDGETATIARSSDAIALDGVPCDAATVTTTDAIVVDGTGIPAAIVIDLSGGDLAPGLSAESDGGNPEIEFSINLPAGSPTVRIAGGPASDNIVAGAGGINLNAIETVGDADVLIVGLPTVSLEGNAGNDVLSVAGGTGTGAASSARLDGGGDGDLLIGGAGGNIIEGGDGPDIVDYSAATQLVEADLAIGVVLHAASQVDQATGVENLTGSPGADTIIGDGGANILRGGAGADILSGAAGDDTLDGGDGVDTIDFSASPTGVAVSLLDDTATGEGTDTLENVENVIGSAFADQLVGDNGANAIDGGDGDDRIDAAGGDDAIDGGPGLDTVDYGLADDGVEVHLGKGTATGAGADTLVAIENAIGSAQADTLNGTGGASVLRGGDGTDTLYGRGGADDLGGGNGRDQLFGHKGGDVVLGGSGNDQLNGGDGKDLCRGGPDADSFVFCETVKI